MVTKSKLLSALDAHKGKNYELEKQKKLQKQAAKRKRLNSPKDIPNKELEGVAGAIALNGSLFHTETRSDSIEDAMPVPVGGPRLKKMHRL